MSNKKRGVKEALDQASTNALTKLTVKGIRIVSVSLKADRTMNIAYIKDFDGVMSHFIVEECKNEAHQDLVNKMKELVPHFVIINDMKEAWIKDKQISPSNVELEQLRDIKVTGYQIKGEEESIIITGQKKIKNRVLCCNTPNLKYEDQSYPYEHVEHLQSVIAGIEIEVSAYLNGKFAPAKQQVMELEETEEVEE